MILYIWVNKLRSKMSCSLQIWVNNDLLKLNWGGCGCATKHNIGWITFKIHEHMYDNLLFFFFTKATRWAVANAQNYPAIFCVQWKEGGWGGGGDGGGWVLPYSCTQTASILSPTTCKSNVIYFPLPISNFWRIIPNVIFWRIIVCHWLHIFFFFYFIRHILNLYEYEFRQHIWQKSTWSIILILQYHKIRFLLE